MVSGEGASGWIQGIGSPRAGAIGSATPGDALGQRLAHHPDPRLPATGWYEDERTADQVTYRSGESTITVVRLPTGWIATRYCTRAGHA